MSQSCDSMQMASLRRWFIQTHKVTATPYRLGQFTASKKVIPADRLDFGAHSARWRKLFMNGYRSTY